MTCSLRLSWWATAWLRGLEVTDHAIDALVGPDDTAHALVDLLADLRAAGATLLGAAFPAEGDPVGLGGPRDFNTAAIEAGEAVVSDAGLGFVPSGGTWKAYDAGRRQLPDVGEADRGLRAALLTTANALADLDVARWRPEVADALLNLRHRAPLRAPAGVPLRCVDLAERALQACDIVALAFEDDGAAVSSYEIGARRDALVPLERAARHALTAAGSPEAWPAER